MKSINYRDLFYAIVLLIIIFIYSYLNSYEIVNLTQTTVKINKITGQIWKYGGIKEGWVKLKK